ncbi:putative membrane protein [Candidatus Desulfosporosinus infrequens]|uniref:Putative membrane protein n=1 Tax=Candidatus Desulfosporosinus infrequens TaxID=2043169 RepID=A0A2U3LVE2_9FIRM|nr:putative membrane protein [Candidatus Desulfosporosinus infrequens]
MRSSTKTQEITQTNRIECIDAFRGIAIALMLIADNPGNPLRVYPQLRHAVWDGWTVADLGFPFFIIIMGMVIPNSIDKRINRGDNKLKILKHIIIRSIMLFFIGLFLNGFPLFDLSQIRIPGVLQRIAITYLFAGTIDLIIKLYTKKKYFHILIEIGLAFFLILIYFVLIKFLQIPGYKNLVQYVDLFLFKGHLYTPDWDPEGLMSTIPAIASALAGAIIGHVFQLKSTFVRKFQIIFLGGIVGIFLAVIADRWFPFNKNLWSSSFVLLTAGIAYILISIIYFFVDIINYKKVFKPLSILGSNPLFVYVVSEIIRKSLWLIPIYDVATGKFMDLDLWITSRFFTPWAGNILDSIYFSIFYTVVWIILLKEFIYRQKYAP